MPLAGGPGKLHTKHQGTGAGQEAGEKRRPPAGSDQGLRGRAACQTLWDTIDGPEGERGTRGLVRRPPQSGMERRLGTNR